MVQRGIDILLLNPTDSVGIETAVLEAHQAGVTTIAIDAQAKGPVDGFVGSKNYDAGYKACHYLGKALDGKGQVAILDGIPVVPILQRVKGCTAALDEFPDVTVVDKQNGRQDRTQAMTVTENLIQAHPDLDGLFSVNDIGALGALIAIDASGKDIRWSASMVPRPLLPFASRTRRSLPRRPSIRVTCAARPRSGPGQALGGQHRTRGEIPIDVTLIDRETQPTSVGNPPTLTTTSATCGWHIGGRS
ncbi:substrate-binding domain-containing protein [Salinicola tamaricis]|uniref:substrate-binding domain-containing protein n=1 Tax=Salinicola tamaricis TaxID=1771309 RepID=UPI002413DFAF|nr:substrate-binding domain-containing protein [Salinicola tamaricis]